MGFEWPGTCQESRKYNQTCFFPPDIAPKNAPRRMDKSIEMPLGIILEKRLLEAILTRGMEINDRLPSSADTRREMNRVKIAISRPLAMIFGRMLPKRIPAAVPVIQDP